MALCGLWSLRPSRAQQRTAQPRRWAPGNSGRGARLGVFLSSLVSEMQARAPWGPLPQGAGHLVLRASGLALLTLCHGGGGLSFTDPSLVYWSWAQALGLQPPHPSALSRLGRPLPRLPSQPLALNLSPGWAGSGRAWGPGQRVLGWAIPSFGRGSPPPSMGQGRDLLALQVPGCGGDASRT